METAALVAEPKSETTKRDISDAKRSLDGRQTILGWRPAREGRYRAVKTLNGRVVYDVIYTIDNNLLRKTHAASSGAGIAFLGDSYVFGEGLNDAQTLPQQFADLEGRAYPIYNLGFSAYNVSQALIEMQTGMFDGLLNRSRLLVEFIAPWQAERTSCKASFVTGAPRYVDRDGKIELQGVCHPAVSPWTYFAAYRVFVAPRLSIVRDSDIDIFVDVARATVQLAREKYKKPILVYYLRNPGYLKRLETWNDDKIVKALESAGATVLDYGIDNEYGDPRYEITGDGHPTGLANKIRAERLFTFLKKNFPDIEPQNMERLTPETARQ
ncbi:SGNH/GDSL hydrolase family protein [Methylovirgula ligni]|uniref:SGNH/GDSL hydrolase family protein n=1 Tax=Methylovirgula ligni TaxID=569860 RepID=UPI0010101A43|nr:SGNH/GDSL hydrolase family protein [Methylovirgula ligni]